MNDMEHDLRALFEAKAHQVASSTAAPEQVLRRGRRREVRTVAMSVLASVVVLALAVAASNLLRTPADTVPGATNGLPARTTTIGGVPVTAPAGWTLIDDTPMLNVVATSTESCSFSGTGTEVDANGSPVSPGTTANPSTSCASEPVASPAGVPFLQLANFEIPLMGSVCDLGDASATPLPNDGVAVYVASFPAGMSSQAAFDACPGAERYMQGSGSNGSTFALATNDGSVSLTMAAIAVAGPGASEADLEVARSFLQQPIFGRTNPYLALDQNRVGPGYVLTAGGNAEAGWRLEAGIGSYAENGRPIAASIFVRNGPKSESANRDATLGNSEDLDVVGSQVIQHGNLAAGFTGVDVTGPTGDVTTSDVYAWPQGLLDAAESQPLDNTGGIWIAAPPEEGEVTFLQGGAAQPTSTPQPTAADRQLQTRIDDNGNVVVYGNDLGHDWEIHLDNGVTRFFVDGVENPAGSFSFAMDTSIAADVDSGTFLIGIYPRSVTTWTVTVDGTEPPRTIEGRSTPAQANDGHPANLWLVALPGSGTGVSRGTASLPQFVSWPAYLYPDGLFSAGSDGTVSWGIAHHTDQCALLKVIGANPADSGTSDCLPSWYDLNRNGDASPLIGGVYGGSTATVSIVVLGETPVTASDQTPTCLTVRVESNFANTEFCVFSLPVGETTTVAFGDSGTAFDGPIDITARPESLDIRQQGSATATAPP